jgi:hypothetical protein
MKNQYRQKYQTIRPIISIGANLILYDTSNLDHFGLLRPLIGVTK